MPDKPRRLRAIGVPVETCALLDAYAARHPLRPSRGRIADVAIREYLARQQAIENEPEAGK